MGDNYTQGFKFWIDTRRDTRFPPQHCPQEAILRRCLLTSRLHPEHSTIHFPDGATTERSRRRGGSAYYGASLAALCRLVQTRGYRLACCDSGFRADIHVQFIVWVWVVLFPRCGADSFGVQCSNQSHSG